MALPEDLARANRRGQATRSKHAHAVSARFVRGKVTVALSNGSEFAFPPHLAQGLENAKAADLAEIEVSASALGLHFPALDADLYVPGLLEGVFGSKSWTAAQMGRSGGSARTEAKANAARDNGKRGGRPRKVKVAEPEVA